MGSAGDAALGASGNLGASGAPVMGSGGTSGASGSTALPGAGNGQGGASDPSGGGGAGAAEPGEGGASNQGGAAGAETAGGAGGAAEEGDTPPWRPLNITAPPALYLHNFQPSDADPMANQQNAPQPASIDTRVTPLGKLVVDMGSSGGIYLAWFAARGFHFLGVDFMGVNEVPDVVERGDPDFYGDVRLEALEGVDHVPDININYHDSYEGHVTEGLKYLHQMYPEEDWGYYLNEDNTVRWSDVIITGRSHGASSVARFAKVRRVHRVVSRSGPRDNTCGTDPNCANGVVATWFSEESKTPIDRYFSVSGINDAQHPEIQYATGALGYVGEPVNVQEVAPPYNDSRRLISNAAHIGYCNEGAQWDDVCNYMFGVPPENQ